MNIVVNSEIGDANEQIENTLQGDSMKIAFNPNFILEGLREIDSPTLNVKMIDSFNPCVIVPSNDPDYIYMIVPMRLPD